ncbi:MAG: hypothetical protein JWM46_537 [Candidatus Kaiserbacteria bacterium]|nr:hypothetical protein [Candidatus Kaiserbacteria bacterium]
MILQKKRIRKLGPNVPFLKPGEVVVIGIRDLDRFPDQLTKIGLGADVQPGSSILPAGRFGPISEYNADGRVVVHKDQPMETAYRWREWTWTEWHGRDAVQNSKFVDVPYKRYPRSHIDAIGVELSVFADTSGALIITAPALTHTPENGELLLHTINLMLEIFGECHFFTENLEQIIKVPLKRLNWQLLPPGERPWNTLRQELSSVVDAAPDGKRVIIEHRLETINKYSPGFAAVGNGGFSGYVVLGFPEKNMYVLESLLYGNATYVLGTDWEDLSRMSKKEILDEQRHLGRIIHREGWEKNMRKTLTT